MAQQGEGVNGEIVAEPMAITVFPNEILLKILSCLDYEDHIRFRSISKQFKELHIDYMMHMYRVVRRRCKDPENCAICNIMQYATEHYLMANYESQFSGCLVSLYNALPKGDMVPDVDNACDFLKHFYMSLEKEDNANMLHLRILNTLSLWNLLNKFKTFKVLNAEKDLSKWTVVIELSGKYMCCLQLEDNSEQRAIQKRNEVFHLVSQLLFSDMLNIPLQKKWLLDNSFYDYGTENSISTRIIFTFKIQTDDFIYLNILKPALSSDYVPKNDPLAELIPDLETFRCETSIECQLFEVDFAIHY